MNDKNNSWVLPVLDNPDYPGEYMLQFNDEILEGTGWKEGDVLVWVDNKDGSWTIKKKETQLVLVECVQTYRMRYVVEVPIGVDNYGKDKSEWALDTVTMEEAVEFSQEPLGETIVSHRVISEEEAIALCDRDNDYAKDWETDLKFKNFVTPWTNENDGM